MKDIEEILAKLDAIDSKLNVLQVKENLIDSKIDALNVRLDVFENKLNILGVGEDSILLELAAIKTKVNSLENVPVTEINTKLADLDTKSSDIMAAVLNVQIS